MRTNGRAGALPYLLIAPAVLVELIVHVVPGILALAFSLRRLDEFTISDWVHAPFTGIDNFRTGLAPGALGGEFYSALGRTALYAILVVTLSWTIGLTAATLLARPFRGRRFFRVFFLVPFAIPAYATGIGWRLMLGRDNGALNRFLIDDLHVSSHRPFWLIGENSFWALVIVSVWRMWPFAYLMLAMAMESVPSEYYEAATNAGASTAQVIRSVTLPAIRRMNLVIVVLMALWSFNEFTLPYVLFGGNPPPSASLVSTIVYRDGFATFNVGVGTALDVVVVAITLIFAVGWLRLLNRGDRNA